MPIIGLLGDVHGEFDIVFDIIKNNPDVKRWFQVGDLGGELYNYPSFPTNFHFIQGNHENWEYINELKEIESPLFLPNGSLTAYRNNSYSYFIGSLGGNYSPKQFYRKTEDLSGNNRRFFTEEDYESLIINHGSLDKMLGVDILLTHEAPSPFSKGNRDMGNPIITKLIEKVKPGIHFFGHHHIFKMLDVNGVVSISLDLVKRSFVTYDIIEKRVRKKDL
jgi:hypothetical protein